MDRRVRDLNRQVGSFSVTVALKVQLDKLTRFCEQTELAMTHLEALHYVVETEKKVGAT